jgi:flagellar biosynthesis protein FliR
MEIMTAKLLGFVLVLTRVSTFFISMPIFDLTAVPQFIKVSMVVLLTAFFATVVPLPMYHAPVTSIEAVILIVNEAIYGFALGLAATMLFSVVRIAGSIIEQEMGLTMAEVFDPMTGEPTQAISMFLEMVFILLLFSANVHHLLLSVLARSYESFPVGTSPNINLLLGGLIATGTTMLLAALKLAAPILAASMILMIVLAITSRIMPEMDIFFLSLPLKVGLGIMFVAFFLPYIQTYVWEFAALLNKLLPV